MKKENLWIFSKHNALKKTGANYRLGYYNSVIVCRDGAENECNQVAPFKEIKQRFKEALEEEKRFKKLCDSEKVARKQFKKIGFTINPIYSEEYDYIDLEIFFGNPRHGFKQVILVNQYEPKTWFDEFKKECLTWSIKEATS